MGDELRMRKIYKLLSLILVISLILPTSVFGARETAISREKEILQMALKDFGEMINPEEAKVDIEVEESYNDEDEVRVIVELQSDPAIVYANNLGVSFESLSESVKEKLYEDIIEEQNKVKTQIDSIIDMEYIHNFTTVFNGFSGIVKYRDIRVIESIPSVKSVYIATEYEKPEPVETDMNSSNNMIGTKPVWSLNYKGEGMTVAILDTGIDYRHKDMVLSETTKPELNEEKVNELIKEYNLPGKFYTDKVPYGYNYYDLNNQILDLGPGASMHGMHVAGTVGANGDVEKGGIKGVAPEVQLLAMKVFSNDPLYSTTFSDIYLVAIDHSIKLGADAINMSLGSVAGFYKPGSPEDIAISNAVKNGVIVSVSAGNAGSFTYGYTPEYGYPWAENPDVGVVGSPGLNKETIQVASIENTHTQENKINYRVGSEIKTAPMRLASNSPDPSEVFGDKEIEYVDAGDGSPQYMTNVSGKIALVVRGGVTSNFVDKIQNAMNAGAAGIIVRNHETGGDALVSMATPDNLNIPAMFVGYTDGLAMLNSETKLVSFPKGTISVINPDGGKMSDFTSWGTTPSLELKPEITAPGGYIYSTLNDNQYGIMSGTSMAAPHLSGGAALVLQYIKSHALYKNLSPEEQARLAKVLLINTADPIKDEYGIEYSPRRQGAGLMDLYGAVTTPVRVVNAETGEAKVELKDFEDTKITMTFKAINDTTSAKKYKVETVVLRDYIYELGQNRYNLLESDYVVHDYDGPEYVVIPPNSSTTFTATIDFSKDVSIYRNMFIEGWVKLVDPSDTYDTLVVPFVGFYGDWNEPKILDGMRFIDPLGTSYYNAAGMIRFNDSGAGYYYQPNADGKILMNPGTEAGYINGTGHIIPYLSFLRNAITAEYRITDENGKVLTTLYKTQEVRKNYYNAGRGSIVRTVSAATWDGTVRGKVVPDGNYFYEIVTKIHYPDAEPQVKRIPILIDTKGPELTNIKFDKDAKKLTWTAKDGIGINGFYIFANDKQVGLVYGVDGKDNYEFTFEDSDLKQVGINIIEIAALDKLNNISWEIIEHISDNDTPYIFLYSPDLFDIYNNVDSIVSNPDKVLELPANSIIVRDKAYDRHYLAHDTQAQLNLIIAINLGETVYIKLDSDRIATIDGGPASFDDVPEYVYYYDAEGNITERKVRVEPEEKVPDGVPIYFYGYVVNFAVLDRVEIDGIEADIEYVPNASVTDTSGAVVYRGPAYKFTKTIYYEDGYHEISIKAISKAGYEDSIVRRIFVDDTAPILELKVLDRDPESSKAEIEVYMADNLGYLELYVDGSYEYYIDKSYETYRLTPVEATYVIEVELEEGDNTFTFELYDIAGNRTMKEITITRIIEEVDDVE